jgi:hypothetical protein
MCRLKRQVLTGPTVQHEKRNKAVFTERGDLVWSFSDVLVARNNYLAAEPLEGCRPELVIRRCRRERRFPNKLKTRVSESTIEHPKVALAIFPSFASKRPLSSSHSRRLATASKLIKEFARVDEDGYCHHTNGIENFWKLFKMSVKGTHVQISKSHAQKHLDEFTFRQNHREMKNAMFDVLIAVV